MGYASEGPAFEDDVEDRGCKCGDKSYRCLILNVPGELLERGAGRELGGHVAGGAGAGRVVCEVRDP